MEQENDRMFAVLGKSMLLAYTEETIEEIVDYLEKDNEDCGDGGFVGDAIYYLFGHGHDTGIRGMKILILKLIDNYSHLNYWYDNVVNRIESYDWFAEFDEKSGRNSKTWT